MDYEALAREYGGEAVGASDDIESLAAEMGGEVVKQEKARSMPADPTGLPSVWDVDIGGKKWRSTLTNLPDGRTVYTMPLKDGRTGIVQRRRDNGEIILKPLEPSAAYARGREAPGAVQGLANVLQGPTLGFADEIGGALQAGGKLLTGDTNISDNYLEGRDKMRGASDAAAERNPILSSVTQFAASLPLMAVGGGAPAAGAAPVGMGGNMWTAARTGAAWGAANAAGTSRADSPIDLALDAAKGGATSAALGAVAVPVARGMGSAGTAITSRISDAGRRNHAREKVVEALIRDARGAAAGADIPDGAIMRPGVSSPIERAAAKLAQLGDDARLVDTGDKNTRALLDINASIPGKTGPATERAIRARKAGRGDRLADAADNALQTMGLDFLGSLRSLASARSAKAKPFYDQLDGLVLQADDDLASLVQRARPFHGSAERLATIDGIPTDDLASLAAGGQVSLKTMERLKNALYDAETRLVREGAAGEARSVTALRRAITDKLDDLSPKDQSGQSIYKLARDAWSGDSAAIAAAEKGRTILKEDALSIPELVDGMGKAERDAFRIGVAQAVRDKVGTEAGQNQILKMWANPSTRDKLKAVFGGDFRKFQAAVLAEEKKKAIESVGRGSQTAARAAAADDLDLSVVADTASAAGGLMRGNLGAGLDFLRRSAERVQTPEAVRDDIGRILLSSGPEARQYLQELVKYQDMVNRARAQRAAQAGTFFGVSPVPGLLVTP
ncbi:MAG: hypothetical protein ABFE07_20160 [Armatimonadia bacterium]